ncbi:hypothetical protein [Herbiconiux ginsengi]|uniref:Uncharacterized protein n=1 Tax=Herbiconiux ginsengi TaxID=381665 RepID=A0A1H3LVJ9_9MICO|nr:hypothetical protein [Herbiconiux ginsengi]SDY68054.1 hypothetical protein SAMN05216554_1139 [Herbiconiux ginsengi]
MKNSSIDPARFEACLGRPVDSPDVERLLADLGLTVLPQLSSEGYARVELPDRGVIMSFRPEAATNSRLKLTGIQFYSAVDGFTAYAGPLPRGLTFTDDRDEVLRKLGAPTRSMPDFHLDNWVTDGRLISVQQRDEGGIGHVLLGFPRGTT